MLQFTVDRSNSRRRVSRASTTFALDDLNPVGVRGGEVTELSSPAPLLLSCDGYSTCRDKALSNFSLSLPPRGATFVDTVNSVVAKKLGIGVTAPVEPGVVGVEGVAGTNLAHCARTRSWRSL